MNVDLGIDELLKKMNDDNQIWYSGDTMFIPFNVYFITWKDIEEKATNYNNIVFTTSEHFLNGELIDILKRWVSVGKKIYFKHFTFGYTKYLQKVIGSDNIIAPNSELTLLMAFESCQMMLSYENKVHNSNNKTILLNYLTFNRGLHKDYVMDKFILHNNLHLDNRNLISFHNYDGRNGKNSPDNLKKYSWFYDRPEHREFISQFDIDLQKLTDFKLIPESEKFHISDEQNKQKDRLCQIHNETMFNLVSEACMPYSNDSENIWYYYASISSKSIWPIYFKNVFYHSPNNILINEFLQELGFETFFNNDSEFLSSLNDEYYYNNEVQQKLFHNHMHLKKLVDELRLKYNLKKGESAENWIKKYIK
jgi:hypothetical protein